MFGQFATLSADKADYLSFLSPAYVYACIYNAWCLCWEHCECMQLLLLPGAWCQFFSPVMYTISVIVTDAFIVIKNGYCMASFSYNGILGIVF